MVNKANPIKPSATFKNAGILPTPDSPRVQYALSDGPTTAMEYHLNEMNNLLDRLRGLNNRLVEANYRAAGPMVGNSDGSVHPLTSDDIAGRLNTIQRDFRDSLDILDEAVTNLEAFL